MYTSSICIETHLHRSFTIKLWDVYTFTRNTSVRFDNIRSFSSAAWCGFGTDVRGVRRRGAETGRGRPRSSGVHPRQPIRRSEKGHAVLAGQLFPDHFSHVLISFFSFFVSSVYMYILVHVSTYKLCGPGSCFCPLRLC